MSKTPKLKLKHSNKICLVVTSKVQQTNYKANLIPLNLSDLTMNETYLSSHLSAGDCSHEYKELIGIQSLHFLKSYRHNS